jgi:sugar/nucleoside kinase (ribokinase family)
VLPALPHCDLVTPGLAEARAITGAHAPLDAAARLRQLGAAAVAITLGPDGCVVDGDGFAAHVPGAFVSAVDGTGAGDAFAAGFLFGKLHGWPLERCARMANAAGALATTSPGAVEGVADLSRTLALAGLEELV